MTKLKYIISILLSTCLIGCQDNLEVSPVASINATDAITDANGLNSALMGLYDAFQSNSYYGRDLYILNELSAKDGKRTGTSLDYQQFENHSILSDNATVESLWTSAYNAINIANNIIERGSNISMDERLKENIIGEAIFLRALAHFDMLKLYGGIPYKVSSTQGVTEDINTPRLSEAEVYDLIISDLLSAKQKVTQDKGKSFVNSSAINALLARTELYYATYLLRSRANASTHFQNALDYAELVINGENHEILDEYNKVFTEKDNKEIIFQFTYTSQDRNRMSYYLSPTSLGGRGEVSYANTLANSYKNGDLRAAFIFQDFPTLDGSGTGKRIAKYQDTANGSDPIIVFRLAEMYLIQAESYYMLNDLGAQTEILDALNAVRSRATTPLVSLGSDPLKTILDERRWELCFEGHRWTDLVRMGRASLSLGINPDATLYPIPLKEIQTNTSIGQDNQNPGY